MNAAFHFDLLTADDIDKSLDQLAALLTGCVQHGANIGFIAPHTMTDSMTFWSEKVRPAVAAGRRSLLVARSATKIAGTVQLNCDTPPNQAHRVEILKLMVDPAWRRQGLARGLMIEIESHAKQLGRRLITLDTASAGATALYRSLGYQTAGVIPAYARAPIDSRLDATTFMYKML